MNLRWGAEVMPYNKNEAGFTFASVLVSVALLSTLLLLVRSMTGKAQKQAANVVEQSNLMDLKHYISNNFSCEQTLEQVSCSASAQNVKTYRSNGKILTRKRGTSFDKYKVKAQCKGQEFNFYYKTQGKPWKHMQNSVPVFCNSTDIASIANGLYYSENWGYMLLEIGDDNSVKAVYEFRDGAFKGSYDPGTGNVTAWWCETAKRNYTWQGEDWGVPASAYGNSNEKGDGWIERGTAYFNFEYSLADGYVNQTGSWDHYDYPETLHEDWYLEKISDPDTDEEAILAGLESRINEEDEYCEPL